jgi:hypothetical protein
MFASAEAAVNTGREEACRLNFTWNYPDRSVAGG